ncbi:MAG: sodium-translocating pyrophosphatase [Planctomycetes bacterium]|nr:sodium-translocating pyrophosphatase [Planctomycetota bacterium]
MQLALTILAFIASLGAIGYAFLLFTDIMKRPAGDEAMQKIAKYVQEGAKAFLMTEYKVLIIFVVIVLFVLVLADEKPTAFAFASGGLLSGIAGYFGMHTATRAAVRTTEQAKIGLGPALQLAFQSGMVMGLTVVGLGLAGVIIFYWIYRDTPQVIFGYSFGASSIALFARVGGGIYTKAADVGADLVGKVEAGIPEDDPRNPATIADNVGDNVGDVAGMGADLFESYVGAIIATIVLGWAWITDAKLSVEENSYIMVLPLVLAAIGTIGSILGRRFVYTEDETKLGTALQKGLWVASVIFAGGAAIACAFLPEEVLEKAGGYTKWGVYIALILGLALGVIVGLITEYFTTTQRKPVQEIARQSETGAATNIIQGLATGMMSTWMPLILIAMASFFSYKLAGIYGVSISAVGMLSTLGISLGVDAYGPVADNAGGMAEMTGLDPKVRQRTDALDAAGNTTAAMGKGFAIGSAALTALALFQSFIVASKLELKDLSIADVSVLAGLFIGGMLPFLFSALTMLAVGRAAGAMVAEVRRQFREIPGILEGKGQPEYGKCVAISTRGAIREMILPGILAVATPVLVGWVLGLPALGGMLAGATVTGVLMAIFMANAGGAWDNAKKYIEAGHHGGKGSAPHKAAVVGDTVGDPFKDTSGPSINILIKLMCVVAIIAAPILMKGSSLLG